MERLTTSKDVSEMNVIELAYNSCYAKDGEARYRDYDIDVDARELTRGLMKKHAIIDDFPAGDDELDDWMLDCLQDGMDSTEGLVALFYRNLWAMSDLRERLREYEDTGLTPEQIIEMDRLYKEKCKELEKYKKLRQQGRAPILPCKIGQTVYAVAFNETKIITGEVVSIRIGASGGSLRIYIPSDGQYIRRAFEQIGKSVFFSQAAAEEALKKRKGQYHDV